MTRRLAEYLGWTHVTLVDPPAIYGDHSCGHKPILMGVAPNGIHIEPVVLCSGDVEHIMEKVVELEQQMSADHKQINDLWALVRTESRHLSIS